MGRLRALALLVVAGTAAAQPSTPSPAQKQQASSLVKQAITKSQQGDHATAIELYLQAYALIPQPLLLSNIGSEYQAVPGKQVEALKYFCKYLEADPTGSNASYATAQAKTLQQQLGHKIEDKDVCHPVTEATPPPPPPPDNTGSAAAVTGTSDLGSAAPPAHEGGGHGMEYAGLGIAGAGAIGLGVGIYFGVQAKNISDSITNHKISDPWPANIKQMEADGKSDQTKQIGFMIGGGAVLAAGAIVYFVGRSHADSGEHVSVAPVVTPSSVGFALGGSY
jgi:serine/threonine-protein kinase